MTPTTDQLKDLLHHYNNGEPFAMEDAEIELEDIAPTLAAEVVRLRGRMEQIVELSEYAWKSTLVDIARQALDATSAT